MSDVVPTIRAVAEHFGVHYDTVRRGWRRSGMPGQKGAYDLTAIAQWRATRHVECDRNGPDDQLLAAAGVEGNGDAGSASGENGNGHSEVASHRAREIAAKASKVEAEAQLKLLQLERAQNDALVELSEVESFLSTWMTESRNLLLTIPGKLKRFGLDVQRAAEKELELALHGIRKKSERMCDLRKD